MRKRILRYLLLFSIYFLGTIIYRYIKGKEIELMDSVVFGLGLMIGAVLVDIFLGFYRSRSQ